MIRTNVFTTTYGMSRACLAIGTLISLLFTPVSYYFPSEVFEEYPGDQHLMPNLFLMLGRENLQLTTLFAIFVLLLVVSGYLPQLSGILHAWVSHSFFSASVIIEGGDQLTQILTLLLMPVTLADKRINHWCHTDFFSYKRGPVVEYFCYSTIVIIQIQMSIVYFFAASDKLAVQQWIDGSAFYYWFNSYPFGANQLLHFLFDPIVENIYLSPIVNWGVLILEVCLCAAFFMNRTAKNYLLILGILFHLLIFFVHGLGTFFFAMTGGLILYLYPNYSNFSFKDLILTRGNPVD